MLALLGLMSTAGCDGRTNEVLPASERDTVPPSEYEDLIGRWLPAEKNEDLDKDGVELHLHEGGEISGSDGCNDLVGGGWNLVVDDERQLQMVVLENVGSTLARCSISEPWPFTPAAMFRVEGNELVLIVEGEDRGRLVRGD